MSPDFDRYHEGARFTCPRRVFCDQAMPDDLKALLGFDAHPPMVHLRLWTGDQRHVGFVVVHSIANSSGELLAFAQPGLWTLSTVRRLAIWIFVVCGLRSVTANSFWPNDDLATYLTRLGFRRVGNETWEMCASDCRWLPARDRITSGSA